MYFEAKNLLMHLHVQLQVLFVDVTTNHINNFIASETVCRRSRQIPRVMQCQFIQSAIQKMSLI